MTCFPSSHGSHSKVWRPLSSRHFFLIFPNEDDQVIHETF